MLTWFFCGGCILFAKVLKNRNTYHLYAFLIIASATIFRIVLSCLGWPPTDSDEATYHLMAFHIWKNGEHPIFMYGQNYMGTIEAYIGAVLFRIFGPSVLVMRIEMAGLFALFLLGLYLLTYRLYTPRFALCTIAFLAPGTELILRRQVQPIGGYGEIYVFGVQTCPPLFPMGYFLRIGSMERCPHRAVSARCRYPARGVLLERDVEMGSVATSHRVHRWWLSVHLL